ncbi:hypothetical protein D3C86_1825420 [compost metagenome]
MDRQLGLVGQAMTREAVGLEDGNHGAVDQATAIDRSHNVVVAIELADHRNHGFREGFTIDPFTETLVGLLSHGQYLPHM